MKISKKEVEDWIKNPDLATGSAMLNLIKPNHKVNDLRAIGAKLCYYVGIQLPIPFPPFLKKTNAIQKIFLDGLNDRLNQALAKKNQLDAEVLKISFDDLTPPQRDEIVCRLTELIVELEETQASENELNSYSLFSDEEKAIWDRFFSSNENEMPYLERLKGIAEIFESVKFDNIDLKIQSNENPATSTEPNENPDTEPAEVSELPTSNSESPSTELAENSVTEPAEVPSTEPAEVPIFIERIIKEHTHLVQLRSQLADDRLKIQEASTPANNKARKIISESIHQHSQRIEALWQAKEDYFTKNIQPDMEILFPGEKPKPVQDEKALRAKLHSLKSLQKKDENMLKYQEMSVQKTENPMPSGPKRERIEARITNRAAEISEIEKQITP